MSEACKAPDIFFIMDAACSPRVFRTLRTLPGAFFIGCFRPTYLCF